jgi:hypothetical protein
MPLAFRPGKNMLAQHKSRLTLAKLAMALLPATASMGLFAHQRMADGVTTSATLNVEYSDIFAYSIFACLLLLFLALASVVRKLSREDRF